MTWPYGFVLNAESLSNPKRDHSIAFDIVGALVCVPMTTVFFIFTTAFFEGSLDDREDGFERMIWFCYPTYWLLWIGWVVYRSVAIWPQIWRNRKGDSYHRTRTPDDIRLSDSASVKMMPGIEPLDVAVCRLDDPDPTRGPIE